MNTAGSTVVGQNIAAKEFDRVKKILVRIAAITLSPATLFSSILLLFPDLIFHFFTDDTAVLAIVGGYLSIAVMLFYGSALRSIMYALINGSGNYKINFAPPFWIALFCASIWRFCSVWCWI